MFSVVVPVFNHASFLTRAVESAVRDPLVSEVLLVDDGSRDGSDRIIRRLCTAYSGRVRDIGDGRRTNRGAHARLNELVAAATNEWVAVLNSDDAFTPSRFKVMHRALRDRGVDFVSGWLLVMDECGRVFGRKRGWLDPEYPFPESLRPQRVGKAAPVEAAADSDAFLGRLFNQNFIATTSNMAFTRAAWERVGGFRSYRYCHDWDFAIRMAMTTRVSWCPQYLTIYRIHRSNTIAESADAVRAEVRRMFDQLRFDRIAMDAPALVQLGVRENRYLKVA